MSLVAYIPNITYIIPYARLYRVDSFFYPVPTPSPNKTGFCVDLTARSKSSFDRVWNVFDSEDTIRK